LQILASDGVWDVLTPAQAVELVEHKRRTGSNARAAARALVEAVIAEAAAAQEEQDNTSAIVVFLGPARGHVHAGGEDSIKRAQEIAMAATSTFFSGSSVAAVAGSGIADRNEGGAMTVLQPRGAPAASGQCLTGSGKLSRP
jgi:hypothetical protein